MIVHIAALVILGVLAGWVWMGMFRRRPAPSVPMPSPITIARIEPGIHRITKLKDSTDMATIKERLAAIEAALANTPTGASADALNALARRLTAVEGAIGNDPEPGMPATAAVAADDPFPQPNA